MSDLISLVLVVAPSQPATTVGFLGRAVYRFLLDVIGQADPALAAELHDDPGRKPFTCSALVGGQRRGRNRRYFTPERPAWLRLAGLTQEVSHHLRQLALTPPESISLDRTTFAVLQATAHSEVHPWAGQTTYEKLAAPYLLGSHANESHVGLQFSSPTTFHEKKPGNKSQSWPVPMPKWVFDSLWQQWNLFSPIPIEEPVREWVEDHVALSRYRLSTRAVPIHENVPQPGCIGEAHYVILQPDRYWIGVLHLLAAYSFYAGIGYQTTIGLGQARPI